MLGAFSFFVGGNLMFTVEQTYDLASLTALCRAARKTTQRWKTVLRAIGWVILVLGVVTFTASLLLEGWPENGTPIIFPILLLLLLLEDKLNAWIALRQLVPGTAHSTTVFANDAYTVTTDTTVTEYRYENVTSLCETERYFLFFLGKKHGQCFDKRGFQQGDPDAFRVWLEQKTGMTFKKIK